MHRLLQIFPLGARGQETQEQKVRGIGCQWGEIELLLGHACEQSVTTTPAARSLVKAKRWTKRCSDGQKKVKVTIRCQLFYQSEVRWPSPYTISGLSCWANPLRQAQCSKLLVMAHLAWLKLSVTEQQSPTMLGSDHSFILAWMNFPEAHYALQGWH